MDRYDYTVDWVEYDELRRTVVRAYLGWIPVALAVAVLSVVFPALPRVLAVLPLTYLAWFIRVRRQLRQWLCPRCGRPFFFRRKLFSHYRWFAVKCVHCSFSKYTLSGDPLDPSGSVTPGKTDL